MSISDFENIWVSKVTEELLKSFPDEFIKSFKNQSLELPQKPLIKGSELFGFYEIIDNEGNSILSTDNIYKLKYVLYANRNLPGSIKIPINDDEIKICVKNYENHLDEIVQKISKDHKKYFKDSEDTRKVVNKIFKILNLYRH